jgi:hypothetical protein
MPFLNGYGMPSCDLWGRNEGQLSLQINSWLGAISFDKDFSKQYILMSFRCVLNCIMLSAAAIVQILRKNDAMLLKVRWVICQMLRYISGGLGSCIISRQSTLLFH